MFTGLIQEVGKFAHKEAHKDFFLFGIEHAIAAVSKIGESIAINGCCLTVTKISDSTLVEFHLLQETLNCTNLGELRSGDPVNCEFSLAVGDRFGGHLVQGHVDATAGVISANFVGNDFRLEIEIPSGFRQYVISKGSIAVNGVSLTIAELKEDSFVVWVIPHTLEKTNLRY